MADHDILTRIDGLVASDPLVDDTSRWLRAVEGDGAPGQQLCVEVRDPHDDGVRVTAERR